MGDSTSLPTWMRHTTMATALLFLVVLASHVTSPSLGRYDSLILWARQALFASSAPLTWNAAPMYGDIDSTLCTIERVSYDEMTAEAFMRFYEEQRPVILHYPTTTGVTRNAEFQRAVQKQRLLDHHGSDEITLSTGNRNSYAKRNTTLADYILHYVHPQREDVPGNASWYHFGDPHHRYWREVNSLYELPAKFMRLHTDPALSFGLAGSGTGVPFHTRGAVFAETLYGRKRWWLSAPSREPRYDPDANTLQWLRHVRPTFTSAEAENLQECVCGRGDVIYIPSNWHHATLNIGEAVFMSVFL